MFQERIFSPVCCHQSKLLFKDTNYERGKRSTFAVCKYPYVALCEAAMSQLIMKDPSNDIRLSGKHVNLRCFIHGHIPTTSIFYCVATSVAHP